jgi:hypothetical protein
MFLNRQSNFGFLKNSKNLFVNSFSKIKFYYQKKYFKSDMETHTDHKKQSELDKLLSELNIKETNMPNVPKKDIRYQR